jgi:hypothetical protein
MTNRFSVFVQPDPMSLDGYADSAQCTDRSASDKGWPLLPVPHRIRATRVVDREHAFIGDGTQPIACFVVSRYGDRSFGQHQSRVTLPLPAPGADERFGSECDRRKRLGRQRGGRAPFGPRSLLCRKQRT